MYGTPILNIYVLCIKTKNITLNMIFFQYSEFWEFCIKKKKMSRLKNKSKLKSTRTRAGKRDHFDSNNTSYELWCLLLNHLIAVRRFSQNMFTTSRHKGFISTVENNDNYRTNSTILLYRTFFEYWYCYFHSWNFFTHI